MSEYNFQDLILLIGTNPLPNFVVAQYFLLNNSNLERIWLIHSEDNRLQKGSYLQAEQLEKIIRKEWEGKHNSLNFPLQKVGLSDVSDARNIISTIHDNFLNRLDVFHFNYTGGTKSMSIHVYNYLKNLDNCTSKSFSYLDARNFRLMDDDDGLIADSLREKVSLDFMDLIKLHGFERKNEDKINIFDNMILKMSEIIEQDKLDILFNETDGYYRSLFYNKNYDLAKKPSDLDKIKIDNFTPNDIFVSVIQSMPEEYQIFNSDKKFNWEIDRKKFTKALTYIDGFWLEDYLIKVLSDNFLDQRLKMYSNWEIRKPEWIKINPDLYFELDILFIYGYQLTGVSVTTDSTKKLCKSKGFEIILRTRQIGGDEAKAVVVTFLDNSRKEQLQEELIYETGTSEDRIRILGINDIKKEKLVTSFKNYLFHE
ncbi:MAG: hypothetical protein ACOY90_18615 [Candidatus Zhuqueibacterota bacterium]